MVRSTKSNNSLILGDLLSQPQLPEEQTYQARLRAAAAGSVSEADVQEIVKGIVERAKTGDKLAIDQFFRQVLGSDSRPTAVHNPVVVTDVETAARLGQAANRRVAG